jgi:hypothetical protein
MVFTVDLCRDHMDTEIMAALFMGAIAIAAVIILSGNATWLKIGSRGLAAALLVGMIAGVVGEVLLSGGRSPAVRMFLAAVAFFGGGAGITMEQRMMRPKEGAER